LTTPDPKRVAAAYLNQTQARGRTKTAGEVIFRKDRGGDKNEWAWGGIGPSKREISEDFEWNAKYLKPLTLVLRSTLMAMGHALSGQNVFARVKSADISPDGNMGGRGYIQKIADMRRQYMNVVEALSALSDTLHDELKAPHWHIKDTDGGDRARKEVQEILQDANEILKDPEGFAKAEEAELDAEHENTATNTARKKTASVLAVAAAHLGRKS